MTTRADLLALADRCNKAMEADRELDFAIWHLVATTHDYGMKGAPFYTASLDAALTLVPEGWGYCVGDVHPPSEAYLDPGRPWAEIWLRGSRKLKLDDMTYDGFGRNGLNAATPALAVCAAALRARAHQLEEVVP